MIEFFMTVATGAFAVIICAGAIAVLVVLIAICKELIK